MLLESIRPHRAAPPEVVFVRPCRGSSHIEPVVRTPFVPRKSGGIEVAFSPVILKFSFWDFKPLMELPSLPLR